LEVLNVIAIKVHLVSYDMWNMQLDHMTTSQPICKDHLYFHNKTAKFQSYIF